jgi:hypothetical protein
MTVLSISQLPPNNSINPNTKQQQKMKDWLDALLAASGHNNSAKPAEAEPQVVAAAVEVRLQISTVPQPRNSLFLIT